MASLLLRTYLRYLVPLTVLSALALAPVLYVASRVSVPVDVATARVQVRLTWALAAIAIAFQLLLVAGVAPSLRALTTSTPLSQARALLAGLAGLVRGFAPWLVSIVAVVLGGVALVVPGALLLVLVSLTGASERLGDASVRSAVTDSVEVARAQLPRVALLVAGVIMVNLAVVLAAQTVLVPVISRKAAPVQLVPVQTLVRVTALALTALSPLVACAFAALYSHAKRR